ncbi:MAG: type II toxin-antitoxin system HicA family toxin [Cyanophyceae cyanobacterium]
MPKKIRELKQMLRQAGCMSESGKGSHTKWKHPRLMDKLTLSGNDGQDAKPYQERDVKSYLREIEEAES